MGDDKADPVLAVFDQAARDDASPTEGFVAPAPPDHVKAAMDTLNAYFNNQVERTRRKTSRMSMWSVRQLAALMDATSAITGKPTGTQHWNKAGPLHNTTQLLVGRTGT